MSILKRAILIAIWIPITCGFVFLQPASAGKIFSDIGNLWPEAQWAVTAMSAVGFISGDEDGTFRPDDSMSKLEAVTMLVRAKGGENLAKSAAMAPSDMQLPSDLPQWGRGYLLASIKLGIIAGDSVHQFRPMEPTTRAELASLIYNALSLKEDGVQMSFFDTEEIPAELRKAVSVVTKKGIMIGMPDNTFKPNEPITRAQMAVLLARLLENKYVVPERFRFQEGRFISYNEKTKSLILQSTDGQTLVKAVGEVCPVYRDRRESSFENLQPGEKVWVALDRDGKVEFINAAGGQVATSESSPVLGRIQSLSSENGRYSFNLIGFDRVSASYNVTDACKVYVGGVLQDMAAIKEGDYVSLKVIEGIVYEVNKLKTEAVKGTVVGITSDMIVIEKKNGERNEFERIGDISITNAAGTTVLYDDIKLNKQLEVETYNGKALKIKILDEIRAEYEFGKINEIIRGGTYSLKIAGNDGRVQKYYVENDASLYKFGNQVTFNELKRGDFINYALNARGWISRIEVTDQNSYVIGGTVTGLLAGHNPTVTIKKFNGSELVYMVAENAAFSLGGRTISMSEIPLGCEVQARLTNGLIDLLDVTNATDIVTEGEIKNKYFYPPRILLRQSSGNELNFELANECQIYNQNDILIDFKSLEKGWKIKAELKGGKVSRITVTGT